MVPDVFPDCGSLGGIYSGIKAAAGDAVLTVACDMPFLSPDVMRLVSSRAGEADVVGAAGRTASGRRSTRATRRPCLDPIERRLRAGRLKITGFFDDVRVLAVPRGEVARLARPDVVFMNVNTPEELVRARALLAGTARPRGEGSTRGRARPRALGLGPSRTSTGWRASWSEASTCASCRRGLLDRFGIDPVTLCRPAGERLVRITSPADKPWGRVEVRASRDDRDPRCCRRGDVAARRARAGLRPDHRPRRAPLRHRPRPGRPRHALRHDLPQRARGAPRHEGRARAGPDPARAPHARRACSRAWSGSAG